MPVSTSILHPVSFIYPDNLGHCQSGMNVRVFIFFIINLYIVKFCVLLVLTPFYICSQNWKKCYLCCVRLSVCLSIRTEQIGSHWTDIHEI